MNISGPAAVAKPEMLFYAPGDLTVTDEHTAGAAAGVYKDAVFDTSPVAGKVYKNSENRRKQGVFCGFRRICWCSICPISAQLRFVWCWHLGSCAAGSGKN